MRRLQRSPMRSFSKGSFHYCRSRLIRLVVFVLIILAATLIALEREIIRIYNRPIRNAETVFSSASLSAHLRPPPSPFRTLGGGYAGLDFDDRYVYLRDLGRGCEGVTRLYEDRVTGQVVVIKSWFEPGRNRLPAEMQEVFHDLMPKWPAEIPATLVFAGLDANSQTTEASYDRLGFLPAVEYFAATSSKNARSKNQHTWHLVTPYISGGTLEDPAAWIRQEGLNTPQDLDVEFRSSFNRTLVLLETLHTKGYCHDDVKMDNILVLGPYDWILSDLGNVREIQHPYHYNPDWKRKGQ
ncbi:MAG: hypothetical protein M1816_007881 [Peltula sp. TS41687]|nr:MAG: hypothetical protein M1816_007881 [Peltula sp. TS41687]